VTYRPRWGTGELANTTFGFLTTGGIGTVNITLQPTVGKEWRRFIQIGEGSHNSRTATSVAHASIGHPLPALDSASVVVDLLPIAENIQIAGRTVSWSYPDGGVGAADRVIVNAIGQGTNGDTVLRIMTAPSRTSVTVPASLPGDFAINSLVDVQYATVMAEDFDSVSGYSDSLSHEPPILQFPGSIGDTFGRKSLRSTAP